MPVGSRLVHVVEHDTTEQVRGVDEVAGAAESLGVGEDAAAQAERAMQEHDLSQEPRPR